MYRLGLLACDFVPHELRNRFEDYPVMYRAAIDSASVAVEWRIYRTYAGELPGALTECDGYITTGSRSGAYHAEEWIAALLQFIRDLEASAQPLVGICFGHQAIAQALGGKVEKSDRGWGIGLQRYQTNANAGGAWFEPRLDEFTVPVCHQDQVIDLPAGARLLASSEHCKNFMVQFSETMLGLQGHPEFNRGYIEALLDWRKGLILGSVREDAINSLDRRGDNAKIMRWIANFLGIE